MSEITRREAVLRAAAVLAAAATGAAAAAATSPPAAPAAGYGRCSKCNCRHFEGSSSTCANSGCGHAYSDHY